MVQTARSEENAIGVPRRGMVQYFLFGIAFRHVGVRFKTSASKKLSPPFEQIRKSFLRLSA